METGFEPFKNKDSILLILGSFPSIKSRETGFYYGNKQNKFWAILAEFFAEEAPKSIEEKKKFLTKHKIALWDIVLNCEIKGSLDSNIKNYEIADIKKEFENGNLKHIILNGRKAEQLFISVYGNFPVPYSYLPSTSPANTAFKKEIWFDKLAEIYKSES